MTKWWGEISFEINQMKSWKIGNRQIVVQRMAREWLVWNDEVKEESFESLDLTTISNLEALVDIPVQRFLVDNTKDILSVVPKLANRSVIVRPSSTLSLLPGEKNHIVCKLAFVAYIYRS